MCKVLNMELLKKFLTNCMSEILKKYVLFVCKYFQKYVEKCWFIELNMLNLKHLQFQKLLPKYKQVLRKSFDIFLGSLAGMKCWKLQVPGLLAGGPFLARMRNSSAVSCLMKRHNSVSFPVLLFFKMLPVTNLTRS